MVKKHAKKIILACLAIIMLGMFLALPKIMSLFYKDKVCPYTYFGEVNLSLMDAESAKSQISDSLEALNSSSVIFIYGGQTFEFLPADLGVSYDVEATKSELSIMGEGNIFLALWNLLSIKDIDPVYAIDEEKVVAALSILNTEIEEQNAYLYLDAATNEVALMPEANGQTLNKEKLLSDIEDRFSAMSTGTIDVETLVIEPTIKTSDIEPFREEAKNVLTKSVTITYGEDEWIFSANENAKMLSFTAKNTESSEENSTGSGEIETDMEILISEDELEKYIEANMSESVTVLSQNVVITMDESKNITFEGTAIDGISVDLSGLSEMLKTALAGDVVTITLPIKTEKGEVEVPAELQEMGIKELISTGYTNYYGSPYNRTLNIAVGLSKFNGILIAPGEEFSFVTTLGPVDASTGYYKELVITENETRPEYGGGLCQVSSTMYRGALYAGLPITARTEHSYAVSYYAYPSGYGIDATIYQPSPDLKFINDTGSYILIQAYTEGTDAYIKFYGTSDGRTVSMDGPYYSKYVSAPADVIIYTTELAPGEKQKKDTAHTGFDADWCRTITFADGTQTEENIHSHYQAWPAKYLVGAEEEQIDGSGSGTVTE